MENVEDVTDTTKMAPTVSIETVIVIRPLKVIALLFGFTAALMLILSIGATAWVYANGNREGLWQMCAVDGDNIDCFERHIEKDWILACRGLSLLAFLTCFTGCVVVCKGLQAEVFRGRYRYYFISMLVYFLAVLFEATALIIFPIKMNEELEEKGVDGWSFGWAYVVGWAAVVMIMAAAMMICLDKDTDEIIYREKTYYNNAAIEES